ncbi:hypothetical protein [Desulfopila aestuarii]|uniref:Uncharacterized protein n=1 Tax=Desulfopila aestuarii DSM 18488 TaxID=1121416 RepID=A0A1M7Y0X8_9BACT|nr:hypothetical protein [Desulfopila aestuarii]SHO45296.1 hypothetical protein SAMN02745220_01026 [Desulfopila aestuarii DSM 18488]
MCEDCPCKTEEPESYDPWDYRHNEDGEPIFYRDYDREHSQTPSDYEDY